jgi:FimV-like protein
LRYVEVAQDETLDKIAIRLSKGSNRSYLHMMYALFLANPEAFYRGNINNLKSGARLRVPTSEELYRFDDAEVYRGLREQEAQWQQQRHEPATQGSSGGEAALSLSAEQLAAESETLRQENEALQQRLMALEQRLQNVAGQVLEYAETPKQQPAQKASQPQQADAKETEETKPETAGGLSAPALFLAIAMVLLFALYLWYANGAKQRGRN